MSRCPLFFFFAIAACSQPTADTQSHHGSFHLHENFCSQHVAARNVEVYLPSGYAATEAQNYPVLYMHDGQNLFHPHLAYAGTEWQVDETIERLLAADSIGPCIVVGIWNTGATRFAEYMPQAPFEELPDTSQQLVLTGFQSISPFSDAYLQFLVSELKPFIDSTYRTRPDRNNTFVCGSSMGGLVSLYALCRYPEVFGGAACLSTHWPIDLQNREPAMGEAMIGYFAKNLPPTGNHRIYFDYGTATLDAHYEPFQILMDEKMRAAGYTAGQDWLTRKFPGAEHNEPAWRVRFHEPLSFLLGRKE